MAGSPSRKPPIWVSWYPRDALDGMASLSPMEELVYRRLLDLIYASDDLLRDDDRALAWMTKAGRQWRTIKGRLLELGKIAVEDGFIRNRRASLECSVSRSFVAQKVAAGEASAAARKSLKEQKTISTAAAAVEVTAEPTSVPDNHNHIVSTPYGAGAPAGAEDEVEEQAAAASLFSEGLATLARLTGKAMPKDRDSLAGLIGKLRKDAGGDDALVLAVIRDAGGQPPREAIPWLRAQIRAKRTINPAVVLDADQDDPWGIKAWCATLPGVSATVDPEDRKQGDWLWHGWIIDATAQRVCTAARLPRSWRGSLAPLGEWIAAGIPANAVVDAIERCAGRQAYAPGEVRSLAYFGAAVREQAGRKAA